MNTNENSALLVNNDQLNPWCMWSRNKKYGAVFAIVALIGILSYVGRCGFKEGDCGSNGTIGETVSWLSVVMDFVLAVKWCCPGRSSNNATAPAPGRP